MLSSISFDNTKNYMCYNYFISNYDKHAIIYYLIDIPKEIPNSENKIK